MNKIEQYFKTKDKKLERAILNDRELFIEFKAEFYKRAIFEKVKEEKMKKIKKDFFNDLVFAENCKAIKILIKKYEKIWKNERLKGSFYSYIKKDLTDELRIILDYDI